MKKLLPAAIFLLALYSQSKAQNADASFRDIKIDKGQLILMTGNMKKGIFIISVVPEHAYITHYTGNMVKEYFKELVVPVPADISNTSKNMEFVNLMMIKDTIYLFSSYYNKSTKTRYLFVNTISDGGEINKDIAIIDKAENVTKNEAKYNIMVSDDSSKIADWNDMTESKRDNMNLNVSVFSTKNMQVLYNKAINIAYEEKDVTINIGKVDDNGNIAFAAEVDLHGDQKTGKADYKYSIFNYNWQNQNVKEFEVNLADKYVSNLYFSFDDANNIQAAGLYELKPSKSFTGYFYMLIDTKTQSITNKIMRDVPADYLQNFGTDYLRYTKITDIKQMPNGNTLILAEQQYSVLVVMKEGSYKTYFYGPIHIICLKPDGSQLWIHSIYKKQYANTVFSFMSYNLITKDNSAYIIYNDKKDNSTKKDFKDFEKYNSTKNANVVISRIDENGGISNQYISDPDNERSPNIVPWQMIQVGNDQYLFSTGFLKAMSWSLDSNVLFINIK